MSGLRINALMAAMVVGLAGGTFAQTPSEVSVPRVVRFDGVFVPADGHAAEVETVALAVYANATGGTPLWEETQAVRVDAQGRYTLLIGAMSAEGLSPDVLAGTEPRWLEARFARAGGTGPARVLLTSVPYALRAADADTLGGLPASAFLRAAAPEGGEVVTADDATTAARATAPLVNTGETMTFSRAVGAETPTTRLVLSRHNWETAKGRRQ